MRLAQRRLDRRLAGVHPAAGEADLAAWLRRSSRRLVSSSSAPSSPSRSSTSTAEWRASGNGGVSGRSSRAARRPRWRPRSARQRSATSRAGRRPAATRRDGGSSARRRACDAHASARPYWLRRRPAGVVELARARRRDRPSSASPAPCRASPRPAPTPAMRRAAWRDREPGRSNDMPSGYRRQPMAVPAPAAETSHAHGRAACRKPRSCAPMGAVSLVVAPNCCSALMILLGRDALRRSSRSRPPSRSSATEHPTAARRSLFCVASD